MQLLSYNFVRDSERWESVMEPNFGYFLIFVAILFLVCGIPEIISRIKYSKNKGNNYNDFWNDKN